MIDAGAHKADAESSDRSIRDREHFAPSALKSLVVKSEYLLQSVLKYPLPAACPYCRSGRQTLVTRKYAVARIVRCTDCGLCFSRPIYRSWMTDNFYDALYSAGFATRLPDDAALESWLANGFRDTQRRATQILDVMRPHVSSPRPALLELGCSWGYFLCQARAAGFDVYGVEIGTARRQFGRERLQLPIVADLAALPAETRFDVIYSSHVLEHFTDLTTVFTRLAAALADDGVMFIEVPNFDPVQFGPECFPAVGAIHPLGFDTEFFRTNMPRHGLRVTGVFTSWDNVPAHPVAVSNANVMIIRATHGASL